MVTPRGPEIARIAAPAAFLLAATIAVLLVRAGLHGTARPASGPPPTAVATTEQVVVVVRAGDTLESIAGANGTTVPALEALNPDIDPVGLPVGARIRVK
jgi:LysM repeat protein